MLEKKDIMRVCFVIDNLSRAGTEMQLLLLLRSLKRDKVEPYLCLLNGDVDYSRDLEPVGLSILRLNLERLFCFTSIMAAYRLLRYLQVNRIKVVQTYFTDSTRFAAPIAKFAGCQVLGSRRNIGHWMTRWDQFVARCYNRLFIDCVITNCRAAQQAVVEQELGDIKNIDVIPNGIDVAPFQKLAEWVQPLQGDLWTIGMIGNLRVVKGVDIFIKAAKLVHEQYPATQFLVAGGGDKKKYQQLVDELGLTECVFLLGSIDAVPSFLNTLTVAVLPSRAEGMSGALLEYMAAGRPIVATEVGGNPELIKHELNGLLVEAGSSTALAATILRYFEDTQLAHFCSVAAKQDAISNFSADVLADAYTQMLYRFSKNET